MLKQPSPKIKGNWVILINGKIVDSGNDVKTLLKKAQKKFSNEFTLARVPEEGAMIY